MGAEIIRKEDKKMSADFDLHNKMFNLIAIPAEVHPAATVTGNIIDTNNAYALEFVINSGGLTIAGQVDFTLEHGDNQSLFDAEVVPDAFLIGNLIDTQLTSTVGETKRIGYIGKKRYVRINYTSTQEAIFGSLAIKFLFREESSPTQD